MEPSITINQHQLHSHTKRNWTNKFCKKTIKESNYQWHLCYHNVETIQEIVETWCLVLILYLCNKTDKNRQLGWSNVAMKLGWINAEEDFTLKSFK